MAVPVPGDHAGGLDSGEVLVAAALHRGCLPGRRQPDGGGGLLRPVCGAGTGATGEAAVLGYGRAGAVQVGPALATACGGVMEPGRSREIVVPLDLGCWWDVVIPAPGRSSIQPRPHWSVCCGEPHG